MTGFVTSQNYYESSMVLEYINWILSHNAIQRIQAMTQDLLLRTTPSSGMNGYSKVILQNEKGRRTRIINKTKKDEKVWKPMLEKRAREMNNLIKLAKLFRRSYKMGIVEHQQWKLPQLQADHIVYCLVFCWVSKNFARDVDHPTRPMGKFLNAVREWDGETRDPTLFCVSTIAQIRNKYTLESLFQAIHKDQRTTSKFQLPVKYMSQRELRVRELEREIEKYSKDSDLETDDATPMSMGVTHDSDSDSDSSVDSDVEFERQHKEDHKCDGFENPNPFIHYNNKYSYKFLDPNESMNWNSWKPFDVYGTMRSDLSSDMLDSMRYTTIANMVANYFGLELEALQHESKKDWVETKRRVKRFVSSCKDTTIVEYVKTTIHNPEYPVGLYGPLVNTVLDVLEECVRPDNANKWFRTFALAMMDYNVFTPLKTFPSKKHKKDNDGTYIPVEVLPFLNNTIVLETIAWIRVAMLENQVLLKPENGSISPKETLLVMTHYAYNTIKECLPSYKTRKQYRESSRSLLARTRLKQCIIDARLFSRCRVPPRRKASQITCPKKTVLWDAMDTVGLKTSRHPLIEAMRLEGTQFPSSLQLCSIYLELNGVYDLVFQKQATSKSFGASHTSMTWNFLKDKPSYYFEAIALGFDFETRQPEWIMEDILFIEEDDNDNDSEDTMVSRKTYNLDHKTWEDHMESLSQGDNTYTSLKHDASVYYTVYRRLCSHKRVQHVQLDDRTKYQIHCSRRMKSYGKPFMSETINTMVSHLLPKEEPVWVHGTDIDPLAEARLSAKRQKELKEKRLAFQKQVISSEKEVMNTLMNGVVYDTYSHMLRNGDNMCPEKRFVMNNAVSMEHRRVVTKRLHSLVDMTRQSTTSHDIWKNEFKRLKLDSNAYSDEVEQNQRGDERQVENNDDRVGTTPTKESNPDNTTLDDLDTLLGLDDSLDIFNDTL